MPFNKFSNLSLIKLPDCVALSEYKKCNRLISLICDKDNCPFKHTHEEEAASIQRAYERLSRLDDLTQMRISKKYYNGNMPWNE